jgi:putative ABC transport system permease protein
MPSPRWRKVLRDLWNYKARTLLAVLSIAVGVFAVGMIAGSQAILSREMTAAWNSVNPASATLYTWFFEEDLLWTVRKMPGVAEADARRSFSVRFKADPALAGDDSVPWRNLSIFAYPDYDDIRVYQLIPQTGPTEPAAVDGPWWPPPEHQIVLELTSLAWMGVQVGDTFLIELPNGKQREVQVAGTVHDMTRTAASWTGWASGYVSPHTLPWLGLSQHFDELNIVVAENPTDEAQIRQVAAQVRDKVERAGVNVPATWIETPGRHPAENDVAPILMIMGVLGLLSLFLSGFLVINTLQALLGQQVRQIGMMRAVGARTGQIIGLYYGMVLIFVGLALVIAIPLGIWAAQAMAQFVAGLVNFDIQNAYPPLRVLALELLVGLLVPLLAALYPIASAVRISAREAMSDYGLPNGHFGRGLLDRLLERMRGLSRPLLLSLRNTFRRKGRLALTLLTLTLGGAIFIAVFVVRTSLLVTLEDSFDYVRYDALVIFRRGYRVEQIEREALSVPDVVTAEAWRFDNVRRVRPDDSESDVLYLRAPRADSDLVNPTLVAGRWLLPEDENAIVVNTFLLRDEPDVQVGQDLILKIQGDDTAWRVVGIIQGTPPMPLAYVPYEHYASLVGGVGRAGVVFVATEQHDPATQDEVARALEDRYEALGLNVSTTQTSNTERQQVTSQFDVLVIFLLIMAVLLAVVGGIGLMGTMSLNVLERTREIGVMRAIGAGGGSILRIVIVEGIFIGLLSWFLGAGLALPLGKLLSDAVGETVFQVPLNFTFTADGIILWLVAVVILAALASAWPARNASQVSVQDALAYE